MVNFHGPKVLVITKFHCTYFKDIVQHCGGSICVMMFRWINNQEYKNFEIYAVSIKMSMTEYHHLITPQSYVHTESIV